jgi:putative membrane protein
MAMGPEMPDNEKKARVLVEKKTVLNLIDAFGVAVKHYLRGEDGKYGIRLSTRSLTLSCQSRHIL